MRVRSWLSAWNASRASLDAATLLRSLPFVALIVLAAALSYRYHLLLLDQRNLVDHTYRVIATLESTLVRIVDAETGQRGYIITGDDRYLAPYDRALIEIPASLTQLRTLVGDSPSQLQHANALSERLASKLAELRETIDARKTRGFDAAREVIVRDGGRQAMDAVRGVISDMRDAETRLLLLRRAQAQTTERHLLVTTLTCALLSVVARIGLAWMVRRRLSRGRAL